MVVGFAALAVGVAINIKPVVSQQAVRDYEAVPGKYLPPMPGQGVEPVKDVAAYSVPVVPVSAAPTPETPAVYTRGNRGGSGSYSTSAGRTGGAPAVVGGGAAPPAPGGPTPAGSAAGGFRLSDFMPELPDVVINFPDGQGCDLSSALCILKEFGCWVDRPGFNDCMTKAITQRWPGETKPEPTDRDSPTVPDPDADELQVEAEDTEQSEQRQKKTSDDPGQSEPAEESDKPATVNDGDEPADTATDAEVADDPKDAPDTADAPEAPEAPEEPRRPTRRPRHLRNRQPKAAAPPRLVRQHPRQPSRTRQLRRRMHPRRLRRRR